MQLLGFNYKEAIREPLTEVCSNVIRNKLGGLSSKKLVALLNKDTLKTMQLLGFNYKEAIREPLTEVCSNVIRNKLGGLSSKKNVRNKK